MQRGLTSFREFVSVLVVAILYNRRLMHKDAAGIATAPPTKIRVAVMQSKVKSERHLRKKEKLTNIAPNRCWVESIAVPDDRVNKLI